MIKVIIFILIILFQFSCSTPLAQDALKEQTVVNPILAKIKGGLQENWDISQSGNKIFIVRQNPVILYNPISLPVFEDSRRKIIEESKRAYEYQITLEIKERLSDEQYLKLAEINRKTESELETLEDRMSNFRGKDDYLPKTSKDQALYKEYKQALINLPYERLPDLYDSQNSIYIETSRYTWSAFYYPREESECRAVLENIYSFAETYKTKPNNSNYSYESDYTVSLTFKNKRKYDEYLHKKQMNMR